MLLLIYNKEEETEFYLKIICHTSYTRVTKVRQTELAAKFIASLHILLSTAGTTKGRSSFNSVLFYITVHADSSPPVLSSPKG